jgi:peroxiredoxin/outer membrane lipoprotein-sorting protein
MNRFACAALAAIAIPAGAFGQTSDAKAQALLKQVYQAYEKMHGIRGSFSVHQQAVGAPAFDQSGTFKAEKPKRYAIDCGGAFRAYFASNGKTVLAVFKEPNAYFQVPMTDLAMSQTVTAVPPLTLFFNHHKLVAPDTPSRYIGKEGDDEVVEQTLGPSTMRYFIDARDIVVRIKVHLELNGQKADVTADLTNIQIDPALTDADFPVEPPKGANSVPMPGADAKVLKVGADAPDFSLPTPDGSTLKLSDSVKTHKAVLVDFWFVACATCREAFPHLASLYKEFKGDGLEILAVNSFDDRAGVRKYLDRSKLPFPTALDDDGAKHYGVAKAYGVVQYPTSYLIGPDGKVVESFPLFDEAKLRAALAKLGIGHQVSR